MHNHQGEGLASGFRDPTCTRDARTGTGLSSGLGGSTCLRHVRNAGGVEVMVSSRSVWLCRDLHGWEGGDTTNERPEG